MWHTNTKILHKTLLVLAGTAFVMGWGQGQALAAGPHIDEVWMRFGGARLHYNAVMSPQQMELNGQQRRDPALFKGLPPIESVRKARSTARRTGTAAAPAVTVPASAMGKGLPAGQSSTPRLTTPATPGMSGTPATPATPGGQVMNQPSGSGASRADAGAAGTNGSVTQARPQANPSVARPEDKDAVFLAPPPAPALFNNAPPNGDTRAGMTAGSGTASGNGRAAAAGNSGLYQARMGSGL